MRARLEPGGGVPAYDRVIVKVSGEVLSGKNLEATSSEAVTWMAAELKRASDTGCQLGIVLGGGNIVRGVSVHGESLGRVTADFMGMIGTVINGLAVRDALESLGQRTSLMSAIPVGSVVERYESREARRRLERGDVVVLAGGTGNPYFSTDTAAALRAVELEADALLKGTKVDGVYDSDPVTDSHASRFDEVTYEEVIRKKLGVMDITAVSVCMEHKVPIVVFDVTREGNVARAVNGERLGTVVKEEK